MAVNGVKYTGIDSRWAHEVEKMIETQQEQIDFLLKQVENLTKRDNQQ